MTEARKVMQSSPTQYQKGFLVWYDGAVLLCRQTSGVNGWLTLEGMFHAWGAELGCVMAVAWVE